ncbi:MAG: site-specific DNA-methyltransferase [Sulfurimonas sp.]|jgi:adenine-specific DNA-methyltransferase
MRTQILSDNTDTTANSTQLAILKKNFPNCFDKNGAFVPHKMMEIVGKSDLDLSRESYSLNWLGKSYARLLANENPQTLLKEDKEYNAKEANKNSQNILIKGDNLEVLKHLKNAYSEKIKMIYIDPPYNTGNDGFVYNDDRKFTAGQLSKLAGIELDEAKRILEFTASKSNSHSAWLTFMYPRLYIARELLREDGVIFISIDENEIAQLKMLCDEVFGEENFIETISWNKRIPKNDKGIGNIHEYILLYVNNSKIKHEFMMRKEGLSDVYDLTEQLKKKKISLEDAEKQVKMLYKKNAYDRGITLYNSLDDTYRLWGKINMSWPNAETFGSRYEILHPMTKKPVKIPDRGWRWTEDTFDKAAKRNNGKYEKIITLHDGSFRCGKIWFAQDEKTQPSSITYLDDVNDFLLRSILSTKSDGGVEVENLFEGKSYFSYPKPTKLIQTLLNSINSTQNDLILDFFAGSGTTAHAVMALNAQDGGSRRFITVQIDEPTDPKSEARKAGYETIFDITKARIEKAAAKIKKDETLVSLETDTGFKIFQTTPLFEGYLEEIDDLEEGQILFNGSDLSDEQLGTLLTTWKTYDGIALTEELSPLKFGSYTAYTYGKNVYCMDKDFSSEALRALIKALDEDPTFQPSKLVLFGYNFDSRFLREIAEGLKSYKNKKSIELDVVVRY